MNDFAARIAGLTPDKINLLLQKLNRKKAAAGGILPQGRKTDTFPQSFSQQRLWILAQLEPENTAYHIPLPLRLKGTLNVAALEQSLNEIVRRHEDLRTRFA